MLLVLVFVGLFADFIANERPIYCQVDGQTHFPIFREYLIQTGITPPEKVFLNKDWKTIDYESVFFPPIPYSPSTLDLSNGYKRPSIDKQHYLGTAELGKDLAAGLVHGTRLALLVGILSMFLASFIGILLGGLAGYFGDERFQTSNAFLWLNLLSIPMAWFYGFSSRAYTLGEAAKNGEYLYLVGSTVLIIGGIFGIANLIAFVLSRFSFFSKKRTIPWDLIVMRLVEIFSSIPTLLFLLAIVAIFQKPSVYLVILIIGCLGWTGIARFVRAELLRIRSLEYVTAAQSMGFSDWRILIRHALPNSLAPVLIRIAFGIAAAILFEASLSFLGIGVNPDEMTWGKLLSMARGRTTAWWLAIFPGIMIFVSVLIFNLIGEGLSDALNPKRSKIG